MNININLEDFASVDASDRTGWWDVNLHEPVADTVHRVDSFRSHADAHALAGTLRTVFAAWADDILSDVSHTLKHRLLGEGFTNDDITTVTAFVSPVKR